MYFGESAEFEINKNISYYIENNFCNLVLNEGLEGNIESKIEKLKNKDINELTKEDFENIIRDIQKIENRKYAGKLLISIFLAYAGLIMTSTTEKLNVQIIGVLLFFVSDINATIMLESDPNQRIMRTIMKLEAKLKILKEKTDDSEKIKAIEKDIAALEQFKKALKRNVHKLYVQEAFVGNPVKNDMYKQVLDEVETLIETFVAVQKLSFEIAEKQLKEFENAKDAKSLNNAAVKIKKIGQDGNEKMEELTEEMCGDLTWSMFIKDTKKLRNFYSITSFDNKTAFAEKLRKIKNKMINDGKKYYEDNSQFVNRLNKVYEKTQKYNIELADRCYNVIISWLNYGIKEINATNQDIDKTINDLKLSKSTNSFLFKLLNGRELLKRIKENEN